MGVYEENNQEASNVPAWVVDTGIKSVLDDYGASAGVGGTNYGPFRLFFSPSKAPAKFLFYTDSAGTVLGYNAPYQAWAQGYNPSGPVSAMDGVSAIYLDVDGQNITAASSFFTTSSIMDESFSNRVRLDESSADAFANAKNAARRRSGRVPLVTIYRS